MCGTSIMGLMMLGAAMGDLIVIHVDGDGADGAQRYWIFVLCGLVLFRGFSLKSPSRYRSPF